MNLRNVDLNLLVAFDALMIELHVTRAALRCGLSQPAMSSTLRRLRTLFGDELLVRTTGGMEPTRRARTLAEPVRQVLQEITRLIAAERSFDASRSNRSFTMRMGDLHDVLILPNLMARLDREAPGIFLRVVHLPPEQTVAALEAGEIDLGISTGLDHPKTISSTPIYRDRIVCVFRKGHPTARLPMTLENFLQLRHVKIAQSPTDTRFVDDAIARLGRSRNVVLNVQHWLGAPEIVRGTDLVSVMWERMASRFSQDDSLTLVELPFALQPFDFRVYWHRRHNGDPAHLWLRQVVVDVCRPATPPARRRGSVVAPRRS
jgi:DNA-binding transcriptional LysR family regulator